MVLLSLLLLWDFSGLDLPLSRLVGGNAGFFWRDHWLTSSLLHSGARGFAACVMLAVLVQMARPVKPGPSRGVQLAAWLTMLAGLLLIPMLKRYSATSCPWDLQEFGGMAQYVSHWQWAVADGGSGHCFPSGHAVAGYIFFSQYFLWRNYDKAKARRWLALAVVLGTACGLTQWLRGAHYISHVAWSAWICWAYAWLANAALRSWTTRTVFGKKMWTRSPWKLQPLLTPPALD